MSIEQDYWAVDCCLPYLARKQNWAVVVIPWLFLSRLVALCVLVLVVFV